MLEDENGNIIGNRQILYVYYFNNVLYGKLLGNFLSQLFFDEENIPKFYIPIIYELTSLRIVNGKLYIYVLEGDSWKLFGLHYDGKYGFVRIKNRIAKEEVLSEGE